MKMCKKYTRLCAVLGLSLVCATGMVSATSGSKNVKATYSNIQINYNGQPQVLDAEPFTISGVTYVPLRAVGTIFGAQTNWNGATNTIQITGNTASATDTAQVASLQQQVQTLQYQLSKAQIDLQAAQAELNTYKNNSSNHNSNTSNGKTEINDNTLAATEKYLYDNYYDNLSSKIDLNFDLEQKASRLQLTISYYTSTENTYYDDLSQNKIQNMIRSVCDDIVARHGDVAIQGTINYDKSDNAKANFSMSANGKYSFDFGVTQNDVQDLIEEHLDGYITLGPLKKQSINNVEVSIKSDTINYTIYLDNSSSKLKDTWNNGYKEEKSAIRNEMKDISNAISEECNGSYDITGRVLTYNDDQIVSISKSNEVSFDNID